MSCFDRSEVGTKYILANNKNYTHISVCDTFIVNVLICMSIYVLVSLQGQSKVTHMLNKHFSSYILHVTRGLNVKSLKHILYNFYYLTSSS